ncbi:hypothetical protein V5799_025756 [Amblyomma americanum]|uniref:Uncharacterized protein n=1 Tax=Amblyomma americanum TaxID=6943 RepID=A0AAQ4E8K9_AMBAM
MTLTDGSRKRPRSCDDESCEFMPISKKINNLRIHPCVTSGLADRSAQALQQKRASSNETVDDDTSSSGGSCPDRTPLVPVVTNGIDNPHYGVINRLLYEAHMQRQQRMLNTSRHLPEHCPGPSQL